jgi:ubiquitin carboxyl-terminal hydrolase 1
MPLPRSKVVRTLTRLNASFAFETPNDLSFVRYELFAILSHNGTSLSSGHYVSYVRPPVNAKLIDRIQSPSDDEEADHKKCVLDADANLGPWWYICDDDSVTALSQSDLQQKLTSGGASTPYLLFYRRREAEG